MSTLHERIAAALGWTVRETFGFSLPTLRDFVRPVDPKLADLITAELRAGSHILIPEQRKRHHGS